MLLCVQIYVPVVPHNQCPVPLILIVRPFQQVLHVLL